MDYSQHRIDLRSDGSAFLFPLQLLTKQSVRNRFVGLLLALHSIIREVKNPNTGSDVGADKQNHDKHL